MEWQPLAFIWLLVIGALFLRPLLCPWALKERLPSLGPVIRGGASWMPSGGGLIRVFHPAALVQGGLPGKDKQKRQGLRGPAYGYFSLWGIIPYLV
jgi:hypothetical protein